MGTRTATFADVGRLVQYLKEYHEDGSNLSDIAFDRYSMTKCIEYYIGMPKHIALIYEDDDGKLGGVLLGSIEPFMFNQKKYWATDLLNVATTGGLWLTKRFIKWAKSYKNVERVIMGVSTGDKRADWLYNSLGMENTGGMHVLKVDNAKD